MSKQPTLLQQFRSFYLQNNAQDVEKAFTYFCVFGGTSWKVDMNIPLMELIETKILKNYAYIHNDIAKITFSNKNSHALLSAMATGDRRMYSTFKRAHLSREEGEATLDTLLDVGLIRMEYALERPLKEEDETSDKLSFMTPFMRFWFAFISPYYKSIKAGDFSEFKEAFSHREHEFSALVFHKLCFELIKKMFAEDSVLEIGGYWDKHVEIDILAKTQTGKIIAGNTKYTTSKIKKSELSKLKEVCEKAEITPDVYVICSKNGFSSELKSLKGDTLKLFSLKHLKYLVENIGEKELIPCAGKKY